MTCPILNSYFILELVALKNVCFQWKSVERAVIEV